MRGLCLAESLYSFGFDKNQADSKEPTKVGKEPA